MRIRRYPVIGDGGGITSFIHLDAAAAVTVLALEHDGSAIYNITDDEPAPMREWLPTLAAALGARPPLPALGRAGVLGRNQPPADHQEERVMKLSGGRNQGGASRAGRRAAGRGPRAQIRLAACP